MRRRFLISVSVICILCGAGGSLLAAPAALASQSQVVADCNSHARLTRHYTTAQLRAALNTIPADVKEYTDCYDVIHRALIAQVGSTHVGGGGGGNPGQGSGGSFLPTPLIVVLALLALAAVALGVLGIRWRGSRPPSEP